MASGHKIVFVADYDCDGITSAAQAVLFLEDSGYTNYEVVIPLRSEGYGIPERAIQNNPDAKVFVALDCGTLDIKSVRLARSTGADCIVIDHHEVPRGEIAPATVLINPKQPDCPSPFKEFCASGLTLLFLAALRRETARFTRTPALGGKYLALAATGTIADLVPLVSANRILAKSGLERINANSSLPLTLLASKAGITGRRITAGHVGYYLGPRINAAGRIADGQTALDLLLSSQPDELGRLAEELNALNLKRQAEEGKILATIRDRIGQDGGLSRRTCVMADTGWPAGVVGIAASRVQQELHYAPTVIISIDEESGIARGSARGVAGFNLHQALSRCADLFMRWGGHKSAAGLTIKTDKIDAFAKRFEEVAQSYPAELFVPRSKVDMELPFALAGTELFKALQDLEPHGMGNPAPVFARKKAQVRVSKVFGKDGNHLRLEFENGLEGIYWRGAQRLPPSLPPGSRGCCDAVFQLDWDDYHGRPVINVKDLGDLFG
ncbi:MAG: DHHA1 domain-containing protein, partial [Desulfobacteraceae bacterium]|nr:DHHA1 domain-containing protein [Desulfobacteraceae bacterium]